MDQHGLKGTDSIQTRPNRGPPRRTMIWHVCRFPPRPGRQSMSVECHRGQTRGSGPALSKTLRSSGRSGISQVSCCMLRDACYCKPYFQCHLDSLRLLLLSPSLTHSPYQPRLLVPTPARRPYPPWARSLLFSTSARRPLAPHRTHEDGLTTDKFPNPIGWVIGN